MELDELPLPDGLRLHVAGPVATLVIDRPASRNALNFAMWQAIPGVVEAVERAGTVRVLMLRGAGDGPFSAGADIAEFATARAGEAADRYSLAVHEAEQSLAGLTKPTIALVQGWCVGGGCELALACDLRIADETARFGITPSRLGIVYNQTSTARVVEVLGAPWARYLLLTGELIDAATALRIGLVHDVHPVSDAADAALALAHTIASRAPISVAGAKQLIGRAVSGTGAEDDVALAWYRAANVSPAHAEGVAAFIGKRTPDFTGFPWPDVTAEGRPR